MDRPVVLANETSEPITIPPLEFDLFIEPGNASEEDIYEVFSALSDLNRACGGDGFVYEVAEPTTDA